MLNLRDYQAKIIQLLVHAIKADGFKAPLVVSPTGSGKTVIFAFLSMRAVKKGKRVLILTHRREILQQTMAKLLSFSVNASRVLSGKKIISNPVMVAMIGTLKNRLDEISRPDLIIIDEAHHAVSNSWKKVILYFEDVLRIGFTATAERFDGSGLIEIFDTIIMGETASSLIKRGYLCGVKYYEGQNLKQEQEKIKVTRGDYDKKDQTTKMTKPVVIGSVVDEYRDKADGKPGIYFCASINHCEIMEKSFNDAGYRARTIKGDMKQSDRDDLLNGLVTGAVQVVLSCDVISEGVDVPLVAVIGFLRLSKSLGLAIQMLGRGLRPVYTPGMPLDTVAQRLASIAASTKPHCIVLDHCGLRHEHGWLLADRTYDLEAKKRSKRDDGCKKPESTVCPACSGVWPGLPDVCPDCGHNLFEERERAQGRKPPKEIEGILREFMLEETPEYIQAVTDQAVSLQKMEKKDRMKAMVSNVYRYGRSERVKGLARVIGYSENWVNATAYRIRKR